MHVPRRLEQACALNVRELRIKRNKYMTADDKGVESFLS